MNKLLYIFLSFLSVCVFFSCSKDNGSNPTGGGTVDCSTVTNKSFSTDINPVFQGTCAANSSCHGSGSVNGPGALTSYNAIFNSRTIIRAAIASGAMPQNSSLSITQKNSILCWIDGGALNN